LTTFFVGVLALPTAPLLEFVELAKGITKRVWRLNQTTGGTLSTSQNCRLRNTQLATIHGEGRRAWIPPHFS
jgi:hypothetical protein